MGQLVHHPPLGQGGLVILVFGISGVTQGGANVAINLRLGVLHQLAQFVAIFPAGHPLVAGRRHHVHDSRLSLHEEILEQFQFRRAEIEFLEQRGIATVEAGLLLDRHEMQCLRAVHHPSKTTALGSDAGESGGAFRAGIIPGNIRLTGR